MQLSISRVCQKKSALTEAASAALNTAREAANASLEIRALIGGHYSPSSYFWATKSTGATMVGIDEELKMLAQQTSQNLSTRPQYKNQLGPLEDGIAIILAMSGRNVAVAKEAAAASERLYSHATRLVNALRKTR